jgi:hypothetical protein
MNRTIGVLGVGVFGLEAGRPQAVGIEYLEAGGGLGLGLVFGRPFEVVDDVDVEQDLALFELQAHGIEGAEERGGFVWVGGRVLVAERW